MSRESNEIQVSQLEDHLGYWLRYVSNQVSHSFALRVQRRGVTVAEWVFLRQLFDNPQKPNVLAESMGMTRCAISKLADRLLGKGLIARTEDSQDGRSHILSITARGRRLVPLLAAEADENDREFFGNLESRDREKIMDAMKDIVARHQWKVLPTQ